MKGFIFCELSYWINNVFTLVIVFKGINFAFICKRFLYKYSCNGLLKPIFNKFRYKSIVDLHFFYLKNPFYLKTSFNYIAVIP